MCFPTPLKWLSSAFVRLWHESEPFVSSGLCGGAASAPAPEDGSVVVSTDLPRPLFLEIGLALMAAAGLEIEADAVEAARAAA